MADSTDQGKMGLIQPADRRIPEYAEKLTDWGPGDRATGRRGYATEETLPVSPGCHVLNSDVAGPSTQSEGLLTGGDWNRRIA